MRDAFSSVGGMSDTGLARELEHVQEQARLSGIRLEELWAKADDAKKPHFSLFGNHYEDNLKTETDTFQKYADQLGQIQTEIDRRKAASAEHNKSLNEDFFDNNGEDDKAKKRLLEGQQEMDNLLKQYETDTHNVYQAIRMEEDKEVDHFKQLLQEKKITSQQYQIAVIEISADAQAKLKNQQDKTNEYMKGSMDTLSSEFEKVFSSWQSGHKMTLQQIEADLAQSIERMVIKAAVLEPLFGGGAANKASGNQYGLVGGGLTSLFGSIFGSGSSGASGGSGLSGLTSLFSAFKFHEGGVVGSGGSPVVASAGTFAGAVRYHDGGIAGLMPGEVPAILQQGETVIPKGQSASGGHTFNINIQTPNPGAFKESQGQIAAMLSQAVSRGNRNL